MRKDGLLLDKAKALSLTFGGNVSIRAAVADVKRCFDPGTGTSHVLRIAFETIELKVERFLGEKVFGAYL